MRTYKFRAWTGKSFIYIDFAQNEYLEWTDYEIDQYTGLKDLYENDLIEDNQGILWQVVYWEAGFMIQQVNNKEEMMPIASFWNYKKVGNIHENPELL